MALNEKQNKVLLTFSASKMTPCGAEMSQENEISRNYDINELNEERRKIAEEKAEKAALEEMIRKSNEEGALDKNLKLMSPTRMVLRRFFRIALQMRKFDPATRDLSYSGLSDFFYEKLFPVCKQSFPLTCFLACKIFKHKSYRKSFIYKLQILRLLVELKLF